jgi:hypothetical protein
VSGAEDCAGGRLIDMYSCPTVMNERFTKPTVQYATSVLTLAFSADPLTRWVFSDPYDYVAYFPEFIRALGGRAFELDTADSLDGCAAVALWLPPGVKPDEEA